MVLKENVSDLHGVSVTIEVLSDSKMAVVIVRLAQQATGHQER